MKPTAQGPSQLQVAGAVPEGLRLHTLQRLGSAGAAWLAALPALTADCMASWSLVVDGPPWANAYVGYAVPVRDADGYPAVLKLSFADPQTRAEAAGLGFWAGRGAVRLLRSQERTDTIVLLLERAVPGTTLRALEDDGEATRIAAGVLRELWRAPLPDRHAFASLTGLAPVWEAECRRWWLELNRPCPEHLVDAALDGLRGLPASPPELVLCHRDPHPENFVASARGYLAVDPNPLAGERAFDGGCLLRNVPLEVLSHPTPRRLIARRLEVLGDDLDLQRVRAWCVAEGVHLGLQALSVRQVERGERLLACAELVAAN